MTSPDAALDAVLAAHASDEPAEAERLLRGLAAAPLTPAQSLRAGLLALTLDQPALARRFAAAATPEGRAELEALLGEPEEPPTEADALDVELDSVARPGEPGPSVERFLRFFGGRRDVYAEQHRGRHRALWRPVRKPLLPRDAEAHLAGVRTLGQYLLYPDASCAWGVLDLDLSADALAELRAAAGQPGPVTHPALRDALGRIAAAARALGLRPVLVDSGGKGAHAWFLFASRRPARAVRTLLAAVLERAGALPPAVSVELFPRQERHGPRGLSSLVKLPLGIHRGTGRRAWVLDEALKPIEDIEAALDSVGFCDDAAVDALVAHRLVPLPSPELGAVPAPPPPSPESAPRPSDVAVALRELSSAQAVAAEDAVVGGCPLIAGLCRQAFEGRRLSPDEARALVYTLGLIGPEGALARKALAAGKANPRALDTARRGLPAPMGCRKLHALRPDLASGCSCPARSGPLLYASPVAFALGGASGPGAARLAPLEPLAGPLYEDPLVTIGQALRRLEARLATLASTPGEPER
ncbi:MAG: hypothetical protein AB1730_16320 [Myxococcota bacterium]